MISMIGELEVSVLENAAPDADDWIRSTTSLINSAIELISGSKMMQKIAN